MRGSWPTPTAAADAPNSSALHARAAQTAYACASGSAWGVVQRDEIAIGQSNACLAHGRGGWQPLLTELTELYLLPPELQLGREDRHWWGACDHDLRRENRTQMRPELKHEWIPEGEGCSALRKGRERLPEIAQLACAFCTRRAGQSVLFVGDSVQGEMFLAFASILGVRSIHVNAGNTACREVAPRGSGKTELDVTVELCGGSSAAPVRARFIRNEMVVLDEASNERMRHKDHPRVGPAMMLCDWRSAASAADLLVLNRGYHALHGNITAHSMQLNATFSALDTIMGRDALADRVIYRGTHASFHDCGRIRHDPIISLPWEKILNTLNGPWNAQYNWREIQPRELNARKVLDAWGVPYLDTFMSTAYRPFGGRMSRSNCNHFCLPGPVDDWVRLLLAHWT